MFHLKFYTKPIFVTVAVLYILNLVVNIIYVIPMKRCECECTVEKDLQIENSPANLSTLALYGHYDASGNYKILPFFQKATKWSELSKRPLCVAVQSTLNFSHNIVALLENWPGAVSLALFAPGPEFVLTLHYLKYLNKCYPSFQEQVSVHLSFPLDHVPTEDGLHNITLPMDCEINAKDLLGILLRHVSYKTHRWRDTYKYPQNVLRNTARDNCDNQYIIVPDIDMIFPRRLQNNTIAEQLEKFLQDYSTMAFKNYQKFFFRKYVFVIPIYEIKHDVKTVPNNKSELLKFINEKKARIYHIEDCKMCHNYTNYEKWEKLKPSDSVKIAYTIPSTFRFEYEPIYITKRGTVKFDERFIGYGVVRNSQIYEMKYAGYRFHVLDNIFLSHPGYSYKNHTKSRRLQAKENYRIFCKTFMKELVTKYNLSSDRIQQC